MIRKISFLFVLTVMQISVFSQFSKKDFTYIQVDDSRTPFLQDKKDGAWCFGYDVGKVNNDKYADIASGKWLYLNPGGNMEGKWTKIDLPDTIDAMFIMNVDDDKYGDIIALKCQKQIWLEPKNNKANRWNVTQVGSLPICNHKVSTQGYYKADLIKGGKPEIIFTNRKGDIYFLIIPNNPKETPWESVTVCIEEATEKGISAGDIDSDGDLDIVAGYKIDNNPIGVCWFENPGDKSGNWKKHTIGKLNFKGDRFDVVDLNNDNIMEIVAVEGRYPGKDPDASLFWFERIAGDPTGWIRHKVVTEYSINSLSHADLDNDGDIDLVIAEHKGPLPKIQILENDGKANFTIHLIDQGKENHIGARLYDMDNDGDLDISGFGWITYQYIHLWRNNSK